MTAPPRGRRATGLIEPRAPRVQQPPRRVPWARLVGAVGMIALTVTLWWLLTDETFRVRAASITVSGVHFADQAAVDGQLAALTRAPNVFRLRPDELVAGLVTLPQVRSARASVMLPGQVRVAIRERSPIFAWSNGGEAWLVDRDGVLFAPASAAALGASATGDTAATGAAGLGASSTGAAGSVMPEVEDARLTQDPPGLGDRLGEIDLAVMRQLLALTPALIGSTSADLHLRVDERDGYVLESRDRGWQAHFGRFTLTLHPPDDIPRQVQCLAALLAKREGKVGRVWLAPSATGCGTFLPVEETG